MLRCNNTFVANPVFGVPISCRRYEFLVLYLNHLAEELYTRQLQVFDEIARVEQADAVAEAVEHGTATVKSIMDGRYLLMKAEGPMMGMPSEGLGIFGYDNYKKKYVGTWINSLQTAIYIAEGTLDRTGTELNMFFPIDEYLTGEHDKMALERIRIIDEDTWVLEIHDLTIVPGETKVMEFKYIRAN